MTSDRSDAKNGFPHFMLKEIYEQPGAVDRVLEDRIDSAGRIVLPDLAFTAEEIRGFSKITIAASGSSRHAGLVGEFLLERMTGLPVEVDFASQYCYRDPVVVPRELTIFLSQSGTTIDTITALEVARRKGAKSLAICNVPDTPLTQNADTTLLTHAGEEVSIAATKSFTTQLTALFLLAAYFAQVRESCSPATQAAVAELKHLSAHIGRALTTDVESHRLAQKLYQYKDFIYIGRDIDYPIALEGALKLKEISYLHAEGYPTGELKHGPNALVHDEFPLVVLALHHRNDRDSLVFHQKTISNIRDFVKSETPVLALVTEGDQEISDLTPWILPVPDVPMLLQPIVEAVPLQLLAYHIAVLCGRNVDHPRNLSKSVVVE